MTTPDRVRSLIAESGGSQRAFAAEVGLDETKLSKSLSGARRFSSTDLAQIATYTGVTVDWLITGQEPELALAARAAGGQARHAIEEAERLAELRADLTFLGYSQPWRPIEGFVPQGRDSEQGVALAALALARVTDAGASATTPDLAQVVESVFGADVAIADLGPGFDGLAVSSDEVKLMVVARSNLPTRQRFTIAHELGHLLAGDDQGLVIDKDVYSTEGDRTASERRANAFAAAFLMPEGLLRDTAGQGGLTPESFARLACDLGVSPDALAYRLADLQLVRAGTRDQLRQLTSAKAADLAGCNAAFAEAVHRASSPRIPGLLLRDSFAAYQAGDATLRPYANLIGVEVDALYAALDSQQAEGRVHGAS